MLPMTERKYGSRKLRKEDERRVEENRFGLHLAESAGKSKRLGTIIKE
jgi:hypothetical protein